MVLIIKQGYSKWYMADLAILSINCGMYMEKDFTILNANGGQMELIIQEVEAEKW